jgi:hypothetical protein
MLKDLNLVITTQYCIVYLEVLLRSPMRRKGRSFKYSNSKRGPHSFPSLLRKKGHRRNMGNE